jgi:Adenylate and Guanylate cyclase catalytic domain
VTTGAGEAGRPATATVLFTDLVGSTALRQAVGDDAADELRRSHDRVLRDAVASHGGREIKGTGDGLMIVFDSAVEAVAAAEAMQRGVERLTRRAPAPVSIRVGLSAGAILILGCAYVGDRPRAARLYEMLSPYAEYCVIAGLPAISDGSVELFLALAAGTTDRWDLADEHFARAMERNARSGNRAWSVHGKFEYAALLARRDDPADRERLGGLLRECLTGATEMDMTRVVDQAKSLATTTGMNLA